ncbi:MAG: transglycosylase domain-containing protein [Leptospiraceae bacterium]|jgi:monofunctional biosynthetic peptidoglycan transglycosylase|nr:transglycosylase domain-containing protein [Leptospiraceae bacterium]MCZ8346712.1 transglycosylase domain-containing protein [Leptospiraceae bacterium]PJE03439.1 MAG: penicillin-binding protein [Leptospira sp.]
MKISNNYILIFSICLAPFFSLLLISLEFLEGRYFLFKENSIKFLIDQSYSIELNQDWVNLEELPQGAVQALVSVEDSRFYNHKGFSLFDIHSAMIQNLILGKKLRGASTITQQLARTLFLNREKTIKRKLQEIRIAVALERSLTKKEILEYYLNTVYWGKGFNGIYFASRYHFRKPPNELTLDEFKELVQKLKRPDRNP